MDFLEKNIFMKLIADSGSTKTDWFIETDDKRLHFFTTKGVNPFYQTYSQIAKMLQDELLPELINSTTKEIYFYGAGCSFPDKKEIVKKAFQATLKHKTKIELNSDLVGAARALCGNEEGIACILGTGSNSCHWNGKEIVKNVSPLGYILGDEGSGAVLGKLFIADLLKNQLPTSLSQQFFDEHNTTYETIMNEVYKQPFPNRSLAKYAYFLHKNKGNATIHQLIKKNFHAFVKRNLVQYPQNLPVNFVGSIAVAFQDILSEVLSENNFKIGKIIQKPIEELVAYHT